MGVNWSRRFAFGILGGVRAAIILYAGNFRCWAYGHSVDVIFLQRGGEIWIFIAVETSGYMVLAAKFLRNDQIAPYRIHNANGPSR